MLGPAYFEYKKKVTLSYIILSKGKAITVITLVWFTLHNELVL